MSKTKLTETAKKEWALLLHIFSLPISHSPDVSDSDTDMHFLQNSICRMLVMQSLLRKILVGLDSSVEQSAMWIQEACSEL